MELVDGAGRQSLVSVDASTHKMFHSVRDGDQVDVAGWRTLRGSVTARRIANRTTGETTRAWLSALTPDLLVWLVVVAFALIWVATG